MKMKNPTQHPRARESIFEISPYVGGKSSVEGVAHVVKLSSNETPLGPSPKALDVLSAASEHLEAYPDGGATRLREAIADKFGLNADNIVCGNGSDELFHLIAQAYLGPGDNAIYSEHGFLVYDIVTRACGAVPVVVPETDFTAGVDAILAAVNEQTRIVFLANPNNPTGTYLPADEVRRLQAGLPGNVLLVLDAAYAEYVQKNDYEAGIELVATNQNVIMTRTFSKIYGLAGLRLGWGYCPKPVIDVLHRIRPPFNVNSLAQAAGVAALGDDDHVAASRAHNETWRSWLREQITALGLGVTPSAANFVLIHFDDAQTARAALAFLGSRGLILRAMDGYRLPQCLRLSVGTAEACRAVVAALERFVSGERA